MLQLKKFNTLSSEFYRFIIVGIINTGLGLLVIFFSLYIGLENFVANILGYIVGLVSAYFLSKYFIFRIKNNKSTSHEIFNFLLFFLLSYLANILVLYSMLHFGMSPYLAQTFAMATYSILNFLLNKFITFKNNLKEKDLNV